MRINAVSANNFHVNFEKKQYSGNISPARRNDMSRAEKITLFAVSAVAVGIGIASIALTKKSKTSLLDTLKEQGNTIAKNYRKKHPKQDPAVKMLKGKRDITAVNDYTAYVTKKKIASLNQKVLNNEINLNDPKVYKHIIKNKLDMERQVANLLA